MQTPLAKHAFVAQHTTPVPIQDDNVDCTIENREQVMCYEKDAPLLLADVDICMREALAAREYWIAVASGDHTRSNHRCVFACQRHAV